jgi:hypothetical protein
MRPSPYEEVVAKYDIAKLLPAPSPAQGFSRNMPPAGGLAQDGGFERDNTVIAKWNLIIQPTTH